MGYVLILCTLLLTVYGQLVLKWRLTKLGFQLPEGTIDKVWSLVKLVFDPYIFSVFFSAFMASLIWMAALSKIEVTKAYPFMSLAPALVFIIGVLLLGETYSLGKLIGLVLIIIGTIVTVNY